MRAIIYARFSSDKQRESSIDDQTRICVQLASQKGFEIIATHSDNHISGSIPVQQRPGGAKLLADALADRFDVLILESLDRLSRDQVEQERIVRRLEHRGMIIIGVADGYDSQMGGRKIMRGVRGLINELYLDDLRHKTHRGQSGQVDRGYVAGGKSFGYDIVKTETGSHYVINKEQAQWVRFIFTKYSEGWSAQRIAAELNKRGVKSPRNSTWATSAVYGCAKKGSGVIHNELYAGKYVWNRSQWVKDPDTGKRQRFERATDEWKVIDVPELRIIDTELWEAVRRRRSASAINGGPRVGKPTRTLFGGMMKCPLCGGAIIAINKNLYGCNMRKDRGADVCKGLSFPREVADKRLLGALRDELLTDNAISEIEQRVRQIIASQQKDKAIESASTKARLSELDGEISRLVDAIASIGLSDSLKTRLIAAEHEKAQLESQSTVTKIQPLANIDGAIKSKIKQITLDLQNTLESDIQSARSIIQNLFGEIQIKQEGETIYAEYDNAAEKLLMAIGGASLIVVAGAGFEPTTFGL
nr:recombinase family protein [uncultured Undibacterium sp.]